jgi:hypothetical protein
MGGEGKGGQGKGGEGREGKEGRGGEGTGMGWDGVNPPPKTNPGYGPVMSIFMTWGRIVTLMTCSFNTSCSTDGYQWCQDQLSAQGCVSRLFHLNIHLYTSLNSPLMSVRCASNPRRFLGSLTEFSKTLHTRRRMSHLAYLFNIMLATSAKPARSVLWSAATSDCMYCLECASSTETVL